MLEKPRIRVLIADDHGILREALRTYLQLQPEFEVVGEAISGSEVLEKTELVKPDIVIMDISMPNMSGIECASILKTKFPSVKVLALTSHDEEEQLRECLLAGIHGYVLKKSFSEDLRLALLTVYRGSTYIDAAISLKLPTLLSSDVTHTGRLSDREMQVIALIAKGLSLKDVGNQLKISVKTVETYKSRSLEKLNLKSRAELVKYALENGLLKSQP